jgi:hypothetical protein
MRTCVVGFIIVFALFSVPDVAGADCVVVPVDVPKLLHDSDLVFTGTAVESKWVEQVKFRADRIWKGPRRRDIVVYYLDFRLYVGSYHFQEGDRYLVFARLMSPDERRAAGAPPDEPRAFGMPRSCGGPPWPLNLTTELDKIARARSPQE